MFGYKVVLGIAGSLVGVVSYVPYFRDMLRGTTKPHPLSWFVWGLVSAIAFAAQIVSGGGLGALTTGITALACFSLTGFECRSRSVNCAALNRSKFARIESIVK